MHCRCFGRAEYIVQQFTVYGIDYTDMSEQERGRSASGGSYISYKVSKLRVNSLTLPSTTALPERAHIGSHVILRCTVPYRTAPLCVVPGYH